MASEEQEGEYAGTAHESVAANARKESRLFSDPRARRLLPFTVSHEAGNCSGMLYGLVGMRIPFLLH